MIKRLAIFLVLNFAALAIGGLFTPDAIASEWYQNLNKAPWTPPGWVFGFAWTTIMICLAVAMSIELPKRTQKRKLILEYSIQLILNVIWTPVFFFYREVAVGLIIISLLTLLLTYWLFVLAKKKAIASLLVLPYFLWLLIATSLNLYILLYN